MAGCRVVHFPERDTVPGSGKKLGSFVLQLRSARLIPGCLVISPDRFRPKFILLFLYGLPCVCLTRRSLERDEREGGREPGRNTGRGDMRLKRGNSTQHTINNSSTIRILIIFFNISRCRLPIVGIGHFPSSAWSHKLLSFSVQVGLFYDKTKIPGLEKERGPQQARINSLNGRVDTKKRRVNGVLGCGLVQPWSPEIVGFLLILCYGWGHWFRSSLSTALLNFYRYTPTTVPNILRYFCFLVMVSCFSFGYLAQPRRSLITTKYSLTTHGRYIRGGTGNGIIDVSISMAGVFRRRGATRERKEFRASVQGLLFLGVLFHCCGRTAGQRMYY